MIAIRPTIAGDVAVLMPGPLPCPIRAVTVVKNDRPIGLGGLAFLPDGTVGLFAEITDELRAHRISLHKAGLAAVQMARKLGITNMVATCDPDSAVAQRWLERLGFHDAGEMRADRKLYRWSIS